jgi:hypothetical protein
VSEPIRTALAELNSEFAWCLDHQDADGLLALFTSDACYSNDRGSWQGQPELRAEFTRRWSSGVRTTRHLWSSLRIQPDGLREVRATSVWASYAANAPAPADVITVSLIADFFDVAVLSDDGRWLLRERRIRGVLRDPVAAPPR